MQVPLDRKKKVSDKASENKPYASELEQIIVEMTDELLSMGYQRIDFDIKDGNLIVRGRNLPSQESQHHSVRKEDKKK